MIKSKSATNPPDGQYALFAQPSNGKSAKDLEPEKGPAPTTRHIPLAYRARPQRPMDFIGFSQLLQKYPFLQQTTLPSMILWGPPGSGKTTLAHLLAAQAKYQLYAFNAVLGGVNDLKKLIQSAEEMQRYHQQETIIFIDEIHRFNKAQQDALLPFVEAGNFVLIGATTENPRFAINPALQSRLTLVELPALGPEQIKELINNSVQRLGIAIKPEVAELVAHYGNGDARLALNMIEIISSSSVPLELAEARALILENSREYDRSQHRHYDVISAFIKSMRGSDANCALLWLAVMLDAGEDPVFIARRLVIFASEDIGNADPMALVLANAALGVVKLIGMPEARISLAQATTYLSTAPKSNAAYLGIDRALDYVRAHPAIQVPEHLKNYPAPGTKKYLYPHDFPHQQKLQVYSQEQDLPDFYSAPIKNP